METSLRLGSESDSSIYYKALRFHAKRSFPINLFANATGYSNTYLQVHGELDTRIAAPNFISAMIRQFYPDSSASLGVGFKYNRRGLWYNLRGKMSFPVTTNGLFNFIVKGICHVDKDFKQWKPSGAAELSWTIPNFQTDQDVWLKLGIEVFDKVPYCQIKENNWTLNADINGRWNVRYDL